MSVTTPRYVGQVPVYAEHISGSDYSPKRGLVLNHEGYFDGANRLLRYFGHGLSYTEFKYSDMKLEKDILQAADILKFQIDITNVGHMDGEEVVQAYFTDIIGSRCRPVKELVGFKRVALKVGETKTICFEMPLSQVAFLDADIKWKVEAGANRIAAGSSSEDIRFTKKFQVLNDRALPEHFLSHNQINLLLHRSCTNFSECFIISPYIESVAIYCIWNVIINCYCTHLLCFNSARSQISDSFKSDEL